MGIARTVYYTTLQYTIYYTALPYSIPCTLPPGGHRACAPPYPRGAAPGLGWLGLEPRALLDHLRHQPAHLGAARAARGLVEWTFLGTVSEPSCRLTLPELLEFMEEAIDA